MDQDISKIAESLHPLERKILPFISRNTFEELAKLSQIPLGEISRPLQWLQEKALARIHEKATEIVSLGENGRIYRDCAGWSLCGSHSGYLFRLKKK